MATMMEESMIAVLANSSSAAMRTVIAAPKRWIRMDTVV